MNQIGQTLQQARIARGMSIHDVASETRVPRASLEAIEAGDREALPAPVFTRGFVRSFAIAVGVEPEALLEQFAQTAEPIVEPASQSAPRPMPEMATAEHSSDHFALLLSDGYSDSTRMRFGPAALVLVAVVMFLAAWLMVGTSPERGPQTAQPETPVMHQNQTGGVSTTIGLDKR